MKSGTRMAQRALHPLSCLWEKKFMVFSVLIVTPPNFIHAECFREVAETIAHGLQELGHAAQVTTEIRPGTRHIVLGPHNLLSCPLSLPEDSILYNLEQLPFRTEPWVQRYIALLGRFTVWDYAAENRAFLGKLGIATSALLPICHFDGLTRIPVVDNKDIDILFIGSLNERRRTMLLRMRGAGMRVVCLFNKYGAERDRVVARAKIMLNMHFHAARIFEAVRVSYYLSNGLCVLSEGSGDKALNAEWGAGVCFAPYQDLLTMAQRLLADEALRAAYGEHGLTLMRQRPITPALAAALAG
jgi:hypothetical protein